MVEPMLRARDAVTERLVLLLWPRQPHEAWCCSHGWGSSLNVA